MGMTFAYIGEYIMALSKTQKVLNLLSKGKNVKWTTIRNRFDLRSPARTVGKLQSMGHVIYTNVTAEGTSYRMGTPSLAILAAGQAAVNGGSLFTYDS
jgi:hypothetical protein|tara:strand:- start:1768 stop:2061 length:294 start_codon:yes stop_codon:yes gene_type:complete